MRTINATILAASLVGVSPVLAAEIPVKAPTMPVKAPPVRTPIPPSVIGIPDTSWSGFYVGGSVGYGQLQSNSDTVHGPSQAAFNADPFGQSTRPKGWLAGLQAGYNMQSDQVVYGIEVDWSHTRFRGSSRLEPLPLFGGAPDPGSSQSITSSVDWLATARLRLGMGVNLGLGGDTLIYATGGLALGKISHDVVTDYVGDAFRYPASGSTIRSGFAGGAGAEMAFSGNWTLKAEWLFFELSRSSVLASPVAPNPPFQVFTEASMRGHIVRLGMNYRFGGNGGGAPVVSARN
jgi:outer membrane immunogenic protein